METTPASTRFALMASVISSGLQKARIRKYTLQGPDKIPHAVIAGGGPAGLLTAAMLLSRGYKVSLREAREDPKLVPVGARAFSLGLNIRGQKALRYFETRVPGLWENIKANGRGIDAFHIHIGSKELKIRKPQPPNTYDSVTTFDKVPPPTLMIPRNKLCETMLDTIQYHYNKNKDSEGNDKFSIKFESRLESVNVAKKSCEFSCGDILEYDLLVGADGVQSALRSAMIQEDDSFVTEEVVLPGKYVVLNEGNKSDTTLQNGAVHAMENSNADFGLFVIPKPEGTCTLLTWKDDDKGPPELYQNITHRIKSVADRFLVFEAARANIRKEFPKFGSPNDDTLQQLVHQRPSEARTIRCNSYHSTQGNAVLLGDAAHSTGGTLGQGANSALIDVCELDRSLETCDDDIRRAIAMFSQKQVPEGLALWKLLQIPNKLPAPLKLIYLVTNFFGGLLSKVFKGWISPPTQILLSQTLTPFTEICRKNSLWLWFALKKYKKIEYEPNR